MCARSPRQSNGDDIFRPGEDRTPPTARDAGATELDEAGAGFRTRPLHAGAYTFRTAGALVPKVRDN